MCDITTLQRFSAVVISGSEIEKEILIPANWPSAPKAKLGERAAVLLAWREVRDTNVSRDFLRGVGIGDEKVLK